MYMEVFLNYNLSLRVKIKSFLSAKLSQIEEIPNYEKLNNELNSNPILKQNY